MSLKQELDAFTEVVKERLGPHAPDLFAGQIDRPAPMAWRRPA